jgi:RimJ/RimL family protein N-acetyltransferase
MVDGSLLGDLMKTNVQPLLIDVPERIETERLILRVPRAGDGPAGYRAIEASRAELKRWLPWATDEFSESDEEAFCRRIAAAFIARTTLAYFITLPDGEMIGCCGMDDPDWELPQFEIGYWLRTDQTGKGYTTEVVHALTRLCFDQLNAVRVAIRVDDLNERSWRVAERCGYMLEGTMRKDLRYPDGRLRNTRVYAKVRSNLVTSFIDGERQ